MPEIEECKESEERQPQDNTPLLQHLDSEEEKAQRIQDNESFSDNYSNCAADSNLDLDYDYDLKQNLSRRKQVRFTDQSAQNNVPSRGRGF